MNLSDYIFHTEASPLGTLSFLLQEPNATRVKKPVYGTKSNHCGFADFTALLYEFNFRFNTEACLRQCPSELQRLPPIGEERFDLVRDLECCLFLVHVP